MGGQMVWIVNFEMRDTGGEGKLENERRLKKRYEDCIVSIERRNKIASCDTDWSSLEVNEVITARRNDNGIIKEVNKFVGSGFDPSSRRDWRN